MTKSEIPSADECIEILKRSKCSESVISHSIAVSALAEKMAARCGADVRLVVAGALLHDLGRSRTHGIRHAVEGAEMAKTLGLPEALVEIIEHHIGAGIPRSEAVELGLPDKDFMPQSLEEKIVTHADNLISEYGRMRIAEVLASIGRRGGPAAAERMRRLHDELSRLCGIDLDEIR